MGFDRSLTLPHKTRNAFESTFSSEAVSFLDAGFRVKKRAKNWEELPMSARAAVRTSNSLRDSHLARRKIQFPMILILASIERPENKRILFPAEFRKLTPELQSLK